MRHGIAAQLLVCSLHTKPVFQQPADEGNQTLALDENIYELRKEKLKQIEALGGQAYPYTYDPTHTLPEILAQYGESTGEQLSANRVEVRAAGRIMAIRTMGKAAFAQLQQGGRQLQTLHQEGCSRRKGVRAIQVARHWRSDRRARIPVPHQD